MLLPAVAEQNPPALRAFQNGDDEGQRVPSTRRVPTHEEVPLGALQHLPGWEMHLEPKTQEQAERAVVAAQHALPKED